MLHSVHKVCYFLITRRRFSHWFYNFPVIPGKDIWKNPHRVLTKGESSMLLTLFNILIYPDETDPIWLIADKSLTVIVL